ncbi:hypothetical protein H6G41_25560 [Tolypothrix sp. FACHB-123]|uniref:hypothetical protein n=1 Tax=Tolypothrix sp. FACHB-123 TaxID=2692868 RepID=UPI0016864933|nr:hypothetical protein [Tolypothrix sp. FACHB-123]MBD2357939.1 hypothetical protein [Tolypothrix sp. FACHB-123]
MGQHIEKACHRKLGGKWKDGCCTDNPPVENISLQSNAIAVVLEQSSLAVTESQSELIKQMSQV